MYVFFKKRLNQFVSLLLVDTANDFTDHPELQMHQLDQEMLKGYFNEENFNPEQNEEYQMDNFLEDAKEIDWQQDFQEFVKDPKKMKDFKDFIRFQKTIGLSRDIDFDKYNPKSLNLKQEKAFKLMSRWCTKAINAQKAGEGPPEPLYLILQGRAGCGKSYLINCVQKHCAEVLKAPGLVKIAAPTGTAAFQVSGSTIHSSLQLPVPAPKKDPAPTLTGDQLARLQRDFKGCQILVIDEMSMLSPLRLYQIDRRLREAKPEFAQCMFGGMSVVLMGDYAQLPPVMDKSLFEQVLPDSFAADGKMAYNQFNDVIVLDTIMRQQGEGQKFFRGCLTHLAKGLLTEQEWRELCKRDLDILQPAEQEKFRQSALVLCSRNNDLKVHNIKHIKDLGTAVAPVNASHTGLGATASSTEAGGLPKTTLLARGSRVYLTSNEWKEAGKMSCLLLNFLSITICF